jgi:hypothetical protein
MGAYGLSGNLTVTWKAGRQTVVISGMTVSGLLWTRVLSRRAAQLLWFYLSTLLFPFKRSLTANISTADMRSPGLPSITDHLIVEKLESGMFELTASSGGMVWSLRFTEAEARRLWVTLDELLSPTDYKRIVGLREAAPSEQPLE